jgi:hypothetical protein
MAHSMQSGGFIRSVRRWLRGARPVAGSAPVPAAEHRAASAGASDPRLSLMLAEWQDVRESLRYCDRQRLMQLTVFIFASALIALGYLPIAAAVESRWVPARWVLPSVGLVLSAVFLALEVGALAYRHEWGRRGRQIETAVQVLLPGIGHVGSIALLSEFDPGASLRVRLATAAIGSLYALALLAWSAALLAMLFAPS